MQKKIAVFTHNYPDNTKDRQNAGYFVYEICTELSKINNVVVFCPHKNKNNIAKVGKTRVSWFSRGVKGKLGSVNVFNPFVFINLGLFFVRGIIALTNFLRKEKPDVVIAMWAWPSGFFALLSKLFFGKKYIVWALGSDINKYSKWPFMNWVIKLILTNAEVLLADGVTLSEDVSTFSGKKCEFLPSATKLETYHFNRVNRNKKTKLTFIGRMEKVKGPDIFIDALLQMKNLRNYEINMLGDGSLLSDLKNKANKQNNIKFYGNVSDKKEIAKILSSSTYVVIPSRSDSVPLVFSEAMKMGTPVIASDLPDISYLIKKYKVGYLFKKNNVRSLVKLLHSLPEKNKFLVSLRKNTQKPAKEFSVEASALYLSRACGRIS